MILVVIFSLIWIFDRDLFALSNGLRLFLTIGQDVGGSDFLGDSGNHFDFGGSLILLIWLITILFLEDFDLVFEFAMANILLLAPHCILKHRHLSHLLIRWHATTVIGLRTLCYETSSEILN